MLNKEKYAKEILDVVCNGDTVAIVNGKPVHCNDTKCYICDYDCLYGKGFRKWANSEYVEPPVDWSKIPVDTPVLVKNVENYKWENRYFAIYKDNRVYTWSGGSTSWSVDSIKSITSWKYAKLAEE